MVRKDASVAGSGAAAPDRAGVWAAPPTGSRVGVRRVSVADPETADIWLTAPLVDEPLRATVVAAIEPGTEPVSPERHEPPDAPAGAISAAVELVPAGPGEANGADVLVGLDTVLTISLEPEWPGNVHVYEITIDMRDGTFSGFAARSSNIPGEMISGVFSDGFADIDFTAAYPTPAYHYAWFGSGPLRGFMGTDSRGNVLHTVYATVSNLASVTYDTPVGEPAARLPALTVVEAPLDEPPAVDGWFDEPDGADRDDEVRDADAELAVVEGIAAAPAADEWLEEESKEDAHDTVADIAVAEPSIEIPAGSDEVQELEVVAEVAPEATPEPAVAEVSVEMPADESRDHAATCDCLACRWSAFESVPVTEGPLAGKAFYFRAAQQNAPDLTQSTGVETERSDETSVDTAVS